MVAKPFGAADRVIFTTARQFLLSHVVGIAILEPVESIGARVRVDLRGGDLELVRGKPALDMFEQLRDAGWYTPDQFEMVSAAYRSLLPEEVGK